MHAPVLKRTTLNRGIGLALVLGLAASVALNGVLLTRSNDGAAQPAAARVESSSPTQQSSSMSTTGEIDVDRFLATQQAARAARSGHAASTTGQIDVMQLQAQQSSVPAAISRYIGNRFGQVDVLQLQADQRFAPTALDRFIIAAGQ